MYDVIGVIQYGLGPIGQAIVKDMMQKRGIRILGAIDIDSEMVGRDLGALVGTDTPLDIHVSANAQDVLSHPEAHVVALSTVSSLEHCYPQIEEIIEAHKHLVSTCEELAYPWFTQPEISTRIDSLAKKRGVTVLGTGVNPGFAMDYLPLVASGICRNVARIKVSRIQDASLRRLPFQRKIGVGLTADAFEKKRRARQIRHVGLTESIHMILQGFGWEPDRTTEEIFPVLAEKDLVNAPIPVRRGAVKGMRQIGRGFCKGKEKVTLEMLMSLGEDDPRDVVEIEGTPRVTLVSEGGIHGDVATAAVVVHSIPRLLGLSPGLKTMLDMPPPHYSV